MPLRSVSSMWSVATTHALARTDLPLLSGASFVLCVVADEEDGPAAAVWCFVWLCVLTDNICVASILMPSKQNIA